MASRSFAYASNKLKDIIFIKNKGPSTFDAIDRLCMAIRLEQLPQSLECRIEVLDINRDQRIRRKI